VKTIREIMRTDVVAVRCDATLSEAVRTLTKEQQSCTPVVSADGAVVGLISESELIDVLFDRQARSAPVSEYMIPKTHIAHPDDDLAEAARALALYGVYCLPVVEDGRLVGVITHRDLLRYSLENTEPFQELLVELIPAIGQFA
jgi:CBS domain-containing protein